MKKTGIILLSVLYFLVTSGFTVNLHYCAGKLKGISLVKSDKDTCCGNKKKSMGCCKEKALAYKLKDNHQSAAKTILPNISVKQLFCASIILDFRLENPPIDRYSMPDCNAPPFPDPEPVYLLNRNFRI